MPGNVDPCEGYKFSEIPDKTDCSKYLLCGSTYSIYNNEYITSVDMVYNLQCESGSNFRLFYGCMSGYQCVNYQCTAEGIFENPNDCSTFILCQEYGTGMLLPDLNYCPSNTKFNPFIKQCDAFYNCDGLDPHGGINPCLSYNRANPYVVNPYDTDASSYIECQKFIFSYYDHGATKVILKKECPVNTLFSPLLGKCYNNYDPSETCSKDPCSSGPGKYVNYQSGHCVSYIECRDETKTCELYKPTYEIRYCPPGSRYSPDTFDCSRQYICPTFPVNYCYPQIPTTTTTTTMGPT